ncbi:MAG: diguanylate cyclase [Chloroflexota bacterium]
MQRYVYASLLFLASICSAIAIKVALRRSRALGATALIALLGALFVWSSSYAIHWLVSEPIWKYFWLNMTYFGLAAAPMSFFVFAFRYTHHDDWLTPFVIVLLSVEPVVILIMLWTDPWHGLYFAGKRALTDSILLKGSPLLWFHVAYSYGMILIATLILVRRAFRSLAFYRWQMGLFLGSLLLPWLANGLTLAKWTAWPDLDVTPITFTFTAIVILYDLLGWRLLDIVPIARDLLVEHMDDGLLVLDTQNRVVDFNQVAQRLSANGDGLAVGQSVLSLFRQWPEVLERFLHTEEVDTEVYLEALEPSYVDLHIKAIRDKKGKLLGRLVTWRDVTAYRQAQQALQAVNTQLKARVEEVENLQQQLQEQAIRDPLTGVYNRRFLNEALEYEFVRARRRKSHLAIIIMDLDSFKSINDQYGHRAGDLALQRIAGTLVEKIRQGDILCRYGGEEFVILMPEIDPEVATQRAEELREAIEALTVSSPKGVFRVTASLGLVVYPNRASNADDLLHAADDALFVAKRKGKNKVVVFDSGMNTSHYAEVEQ